MGLKPEDGKKEEEAKEGETLKTTTYEYKQYVAKIATTETAAPAASSTPEIRNGYKWYTTFNAAATVASVAKADAATAPVVVLCAQPSKTETSPNVADYIYTIAINKVLKVQKDNFDIKVQIAEGEQYEVVAVKKSGVTTYTPTEAVAQVAHKNGSVTTYTYYAKFADAAAAAAGTDDVVSVLNPDALAETDKSFALTAKKSTLKIMSVDVERCKFTITAGNNFEAVPSTKDDITTYTRTAAVAYLTYASGNEYYADFDDAVEATNEYTVITLLAPVEEYKLANNKTIKVKADSYTANIKPQDSTTDTYYALVVSKPDKDGVVTYKTTTAVAATYVTTDKVAADNTPYKISTPTYYATFADAAKAAGSKTIYVLAMDPDTTTPSKPATYEVAAGKTLYVVSKATGNTKFINIVAAQGQTLSTTTNFKTETIYPATAPESGTNDGDEYKVTKYSVAASVAQVGTTTYSSFDAAAAVNGVVDASPSKPVELLANIPDAYELADGKAIKVVKGNFSVTVNPKTERYFIAESHEKIVDGNNEKTVTVFTSKLYPFTTTVKGVTSYHNSFYDAAKAAVKANVPVVTVEGAAIDTTLNNLYTLAAGKTLTVEDVHGGLFSYDFVTVSGEVEKIQSGKKLSGNNYYTYTIEAKAAVPAVYTFVDNGTDTLVGYYSTFNAAAAAAVAGTTGDITMYVAVLSDTLDADDDYEITGDTEVTVKAPESFGALDHFTFGNDASTTTHYVLDDTNTTKVEDAKVYKRATAVAYVTVDNETTYYATFNAAADAAVTASTAAVNVPVEMLAARPTGDTYKLASGKTLVVKTQRFSFDYPNAVNVDTRVALDTDVNTTTNTITFTADEPVATLVYRVDGAKENSYGYYPSFAKAKAALDALVNSNSNLHGTPYIQINQALAEKDVVELTTGEKLNINAGDYSVINNIKPSTTGAADYVPAQYYTVSTKVSTHVYSFSIKQYVAVIHSTNKVTDDFGVQVDTPSTTYYPTFGGADGAAAKAGTNTIEMLCAPETEDVYQLTTGELTVDMTAIQHSDTVPAFITSGNSQDTVVVKTKPANSTIVPQLYTYALSAKEASITKNGETIYYPTFAEAAEAAAAGDVIDLHANVVDTYTLLDNANASVKVRKNDFTLTVNAAAGYARNTPAEAEGVTTYTQTVAVASVAVTANSKTTINYYATFNAAASAAVAATGDPVRITILQPLPADDTYTLAADKVLQIVEADATTNPVAAAKTANDNLLAADAKVVSGTKIKVGSGYLYTKYEVVDAKASVTLNDKTKYYATWAEAAYAANTNGGVLKLLDADTANTTTPYVMLNDATKTLKADLNGKTFNIKAPANCKLNVSLDADGIYTYSFATAVAKIGEVYYTSFAEAVAALKADNQTIKLVGNCGTYTLSATDRPFIVDKGADPYADVVEGAATNSYRDKYSVTINPANGYVLTSPTTAELAKNVNVREYTYTQAIGVAKIGNTLYDNLANAVIAASETGNTVITLVGNTSTEYLDALAKNITIEGRTYTLTVSTAVSVNGGKLTLKSGTVEFGNDGSLTVTNGELIIDGATVNGAASAVAATNKPATTATIEVKSGSIDALTANRGTIKVSGGTVDGMSNVNSIDVKGASTVTVSNGTVTGDIKAIGTSTVTISNGTVNGQVWADSTDVTISGGKVTTTAKAAVSFNGNGALAISGTAEISGKTGVVLNGGKLNISGGTITGTGTDGFGYAVDIETDLSSTGTNASSITGGEFVGKGTKAAVYVGKYSNNNTTTTYTASKFISDGTFSSKVTASYVVDGMYPTTNANANFTDRMYHVYDKATVTFNAGEGYWLNGATHVTTKNVTVAQGDLVTAPANVQGPEDEISHTAQTLYAWVDANGEAYALATTPVTADMTLTAQYALVVYKMTFDSNGGSAVEDQTRLVGTDTFTSVTPTRDGYTFAGWCKYDETKPENIGDAFTSFNMKVGDLTNQFDDDNTIKLIAKWTPNVNTIVWSDGSTVLYTVTQKTGEYTKAYAYNGPMTKEGYRLDADNLWTPAVSEKVTSNVNYTLNWIPVNVVTFAVSGYTVKTVSVDDGETINEAEIPADPAPVGSLVFKGWAYDSEIVDLSTFVPTTNVTLVAQFGEEEEPAHEHEAADAVIENEKAATCTEDGSYDSVVYCATCGEELSRETITVPATGHAWGEPVWNWAEDYSSAEAVFTCANDSEHVETVAADVQAEAVDFVTTYTATVTFDEKEYTDEQTVEAVTYTVTIDPDNGDEVFTETVAEGETVDIAEKQFEKEGYTFDGWMNAETGDDFDIDNTPITENISLKAKWAEDETSYEKVQVRAASLSLEGIIGVNFYVMLNDEVLEKGVVKVNEIEGPVSEIFTFASTARGYYITYPVAPYELAKDITMQLTIDGTVVTLFTTKGGDMESFTYSAQTWIDNKKSGADGDSKELAKALEIYGQCAAYYLGFSSEDPAPTFDPATVEALEAYKAVSTGSLPKGYRVSASLDLQSGTALNFYVYGVQNDEDLTFTFDGVTVTPAYNTERSRYEIFVSNIPVDALDVAHQLVVTSASAGTTKTISYSALSWAASYASKTDNPAAANTAKALYEYFVAALPVVQ